MSAGSAPGPRRLVVDRREGDVLVVEMEDGGTVDLPAWLLPSDAGEGAVLWVEAAEGGGRVQIRLDPAAGEAARSEAEARLRRLRERDPEGDLEL